MLLSDALKTWEQWRGLQVKKGTNTGYSQEIKLFFLFLSGRGETPDLSGVTLKDILDYFSVMETLGWQRNSFVRKSSAIKMFFKYWALQGESRINYELIPIVSGEPTKPHIATEEDFHKVLKQWKDDSMRSVRNRALIWVLWDTGARIGEILSLEIQDLENKRATIKTEKANTLRTIYWSDETEKELRLWLEKRNRLKTGNDLVFLSTNSVKTGQPLSIKGAEAVLREASKRAGVPTLNPHSFRHRKGHELAKGNANNSIISSVLGHKSLQSSYRYTQLSGAELEETARKYLTL